MIKEKGKALIQNTHNGRTITVLNYKVHKYSIKIENSIFYYVGLHEAIHTYLEGYYPNEYKNSYAKVFKEEM